jgi:serine protease Do
MQKNKNNFLRINFMKKIATIILGMFCACAHIVYAETEQFPKKVTQLTSFADIIEPLMPAVVNIYTAKYNDDSRQSKKGIASEILPFDRLNEFFEQFNVPFSFEDLYSNSKATALGSGFIIDESGLIVTNHHVVVNSDEIHIKLSDNREIPATIVGSDPRTDLALLKIDSSTKLPFVTFGNSSNSRVGDIVIAIGNPLGFGGTVTTGIISSKGRDLGSNVDELVDDFIQTDAAINTGNSGGPLFNLHGEVIGVNSAIPDVGGGTNIGIGFAIPSNTVKGIIEQLKASGKINRGKLDITIQEVTEELADALGLSQSSGVLVVDVKPGGSGDKAGLRHGDLIAEFNGQKVLNSRKLQLFVAETHVGESAKLSVIRQGKPIELSANIDEVDPDSASAAEDPKASTIQKAGVTFSNLSPNVISRFNLGENSKGVVIVSIQAKELKSDLRPGDLVLAIDHQYVADINQFTDLYDKIKNSEKKNVALLVKRREFTIFSALPIK